MALREAMWLWPSVSVLSMTFLKTLHGTSCILVFCYIEIKSVSLLDMPLSSYAIKF
jgi:hypothetical protein